MKNKPLPARTVERLSKYRRVLTEYRYISKPYIFSHHLARMLNLNPVQVRRDVMLIGFTGNHRTGYDVIKLLELIDDAIRPKNEGRFVIAGMGKLGKAAATYFLSEESHLELTAFIDIDPEKISNGFQGIPCHSLENVQSLIADQQIELAVLAVPKEDARIIAEILIDAGIRSILNFTAVELDVPAHIRVENFDIVALLERMVYEIGE